MQWKPKNGLIILRIAELIRDCTTTNDAERSEQPNEEVIPENLKKP